MKKVFNKFLAFVLSVLLVVSIIPMVTFTVSAGSGVTEKLNSLKTKFPDGKFWNHYANSNHNNSGYASTCNNPACMNPDSYTSSPCKTHNGVAGVGSYDCNGFDGGIQCMGFANKVFYDVFGVYASEMTKRYDTSNVSVGDWIRVNNDSHSAVVLTRSGDNITIVECNVHDHSADCQDCNCKIKWGRTISISKITYFKHATNYDTINNSSSVTVSWSTYADKQWIGETNAVLAKRADLSGVGDGDVTQIGIYLYDKDEKLLKSFSENVSYGKDLYFLAWYDVNLSTELNYKLTHLTTYKYKLFAVIKGKTYYSPLESFTTTGSHSYGAWQTVTAANCTTAGSQKRVCSCGDIQTQTIPATGHTPSDWITDTPAQPGVAGSKHKECTVCHTVLETEIIPPLEIIDENAPQVIIENKKATAGKTVEVKISLKNNPGIASMKLQLAFGNDLTLTNVVFNNEIGGNFQQPQNYNSPVLLNWYNGLENVNGDFVFATLTFKVNENATMGEKSITVTYNPEDVYNIAEQNITFAVTGGKINVVEYEPGDINGDTAVNNKDLTRLFQYLSGWDVEVNVSALDVNGDGNSNNKDLTRLFQYLSGWDVEIF
ncbi:MAG: hypothetical protein IKZ47_07305 [Clostridia bacterium]|nr:hypothetical protein [Clostridia bacterium]